MIKFIIYSVEKKTETLNIINKLIHPDIIILYCDDSNEIWY